MRELLNVCTSPAGPSAMQGYVWSGYVVSDYGDGQGMLARIVASETCLDDMTDWAIRHGFVGILLGAPSVEWAA